MRKTRKFLGSTVLVCMALLLAAVPGCSAGGNEAEAGPSGQSESGAPASQAAASGDEQVVITILDWNTEGNMSKGIQQMIEVAVRDLPNVTYELQQLDSADLFVAYKNRVAAGTPPDLFQGEPRKYLEFIDGGYVADLTDRPFMEHIQDELKAGLEYKGRYWGVPLEGQAKGVWYNKKMFAEADVSVPRTKDEFFQVMDTFVAMGINPLCQPLGANSNPFHIVDCIYTPLFDLRGQQTLWRDSAEGKATIAGNDLAKLTFSIYDEIAKYKDPNDPGVSVSEAVQDFGVGKRPMMINGGWFYGEVLANAEDAGNDAEFGYFPLPWSNNPEENKMWFGVDQVFLVSGKSPHQDILFDFIEGFISVEASQIWSEMAMEMSSRKDVPVVNAKPHIVDMQSYIDSGLVASKADVYDYSSEALVAFKNLVQGFGAKTDAERDVDAFLTEIDNEIAAIRS